MSISMTVPQIEWLPTLFTEQFIQSIQHQVQTSQQFINTLSSHQPQILPNKNLPIVKQEFFKMLLKKSSIQQSLSYLYTFMTQQDYSVQQKFTVINLVYKLVYLISQIGMSKEQWKNIVQRELQKLTKRILFIENNNNDHKNSQNQSTCQPPILTLFWAWQLRIYINKNITPFYQIWQKLLDQNEKFTINTKFYQPVETKSVNQSLAEGKKLELSEFLNIECLKQFISDRPPVQQKKDPKKK